MSPFTALFRVEQPPIGDPHALYVCVTPECSRFEETRRAALWRLGRLIPPTCWSCMEEMRLVETADGEWS